MKGNSVKENLSELKVWKLHVQGKRQMTACLLFPSLRLSLLIVQMSSQPAITYEKLTIETLEQGVKYGQSQQ